MQVLLASSWMISTSIPVAFFLLARHKGTGQKGGNLSYVSNVNSCWALTDKAIHNTIMIQHMQTQYFFIAPTYSYLVNPKAEKNFLHSHIPASKSSSFYFAFKNIEIA